MRRVHQGHCHALVSTTCIVVELHISVRHWHAHARRASRLRLVGEVDCRHHDLRMSRESLDFDALHTPSFSNCLLSIQRTRRPKGLISIASPRRRSSSVRSASSGLRETHVHHVSYPALVNQIRVVAPRGFHVSARNA